MADKLIWVDVETTGLEPEKECLLELGILITTKDLAPMHQVSWIIDTPFTKIRDLDDVVLDMHQRSGLVTAMTVGDNDGPLELIQKQAVDFLVSHDAENLPMCGSSVQFDRSFLKVHMPHLESVFHYRNIDVSTLKNVMALYAEPFIGDAPVPAKRHRVIPDLYDSVLEFHYYLTRLGLI